MGKRFGSIIVYSFIFIFLMIFFSYNVEAVKIGVSPGTIEFNGRGGNEICNDIEVYTDEEREIVLELKWSEKESRRIGDYYIESMDLGIEEKFNEGFILYENEKKEICLIFDGQGVYNGLLIVRADGTSAGVGVWIKGTILKGFGFDGNVERGLSWKDFQENIINFTSDKSDEQGKSLFVLINFELVLMLIFLVLAKKAMLKNVMLRQDS